jgi:DNA-binding XRE family transcriptional regulator
MRELGSAGNPPGGINTVKTNEIIRDCRQSLHLDAAQVAAAADISTAAYRDIELYEDEAFAVTNLRSLRSICYVLGLNLFSLFQIENSDAGTTDPVIESSSQPRNALLAMRRKDLGFSPTQLGDAIGFEPIAIEQMENDPDFLEGWSLELIARLAATLQLPMKALLGVSRP